MTGQTKILHPSKKDDVMIALLVMTRQPTKHLVKSTGIPCKHPKELNPVILEAPMEGKGSSWKSGATARGWLNVNGMAKVDRRAVGNVQR